MRGSEIVMPRTRSENVVPILQISSDSWRITACPDGIPSLDLVALVKRNLKGRPFWSRLWVLASAPTERNALDGKQKIYLYGCAQGKHFDCGDEWCWKDRDGMCDRDESKPDSAIYRWAARPLKTIKAYKLSFRAKLIQGRFAY
jgi:hypothetical protein